MNEFGLDQKCIVTIQSVFKKYNGISKVALFGSRAKNQFNNRSDIDIVLFEDNSKKTSVVRDILFELEELDIPYSFDVISYNYIHYLPLKGHIDQYKRVIYVNKKIKGD